jgi:hypothetical protein
MACYGDSFLLLQVYNLFYFIDKLGKVEYNAKPVLNC